MESKESWRAFLLRLHERALSGVCMFSADKSAGILGQYGRCSCARCSSAATHAQRARQAAQDPLQGRCGLAQSDPTRKRAARSTW
ncbi:MAG: hypothetical protein DUD39_04125 [Coriobacteriaceae bacterium]|nr:MAG: hypothetical protein DUD39_04125 [Coriobacteriaceae bacterium]